MLEQLRNALLNGLRVPRGVHPPAGDSAKTRVFRAAPAFFTYRLVVWGLVQLGALAGLVGGYLALRALAREVGHPWLTLAITVLEGVGAVSFLVNLVVSFAVLRLDFEQRWYCVSDRALRIREGVLRIREQTMTFANVQQVGIRQGPLQRLLGIADVHVSTAGGRTGAGENGTSTGHGMHEGFFRGVSNALEIRDAIREHVRRHRDAGLGDPDDARLVGGDTGASAALAAAHELQREVQALGQALGVR